MIKQYKKQRIELIKELLKTVNNRKEYNELIIELAQLKEECELNDIS